MSVELSEGRLRAGFGGQRVSFLPVYKREDRVDHGALGSFGKVRAGRSAQPAVRCASEAQFVGEIQLFDVLNLWRVIKKNIKNEKVEMKKKINLPVEGGAERAPPLCRS